jgi:hypothetical protein
MEGAVRSGIEAAARVLAQPRETLLTPDLPFDRLSSILLRRPA